MKEASKSVVRRLTDVRFATRFFVGAGIDIGAGSDPVSLYAEQFPLMTALRVWDMPDGDAQKLATIADESLDFVHSSHCLEHMVDPMAALARWFEVVKPGGHLVILIPDEDLYEQGIWPSNKNNDHKWTFAIYKKRSWSPKSLNVIEMIAKLPDAAELLKLEKLDASYRYNLPPLDQTLTPVGECAIEMVIRKRLPAEIGAGGRLPRKGTLSRAEIHALTGLNLGPAPAPAPKPAAKRTDSDPRLAKAVALHQARDFAAAEKLYRAILADDPANFDALHLLGVAHRQRGDSAAAADFIGKALALAPENGSAYGNYANALRDLGRLEEALAACAKAAALQPQSAEPLFQRGNLLRDMQRPQKALAAYDAALVRDPRYVEALNGRASALHALGRMADALACYDAALQLRPAYVEALSNQAVVLRALGRNQEALAAYDKALALRPDFHEAAINRSVALSALGRFEEALAGCERVLAAQPTHALALNGAGSALFSLDRLDEARRRYQAALGARPDFADAHNNLGTIERALGDRAAAAACFTRAIELRPAYAEAYYNRGILALDLLDTDAAMRDFDAALAREPTHMAANRAKAMLQLLLGDFANGWKQYETRWADPAIAASIRSYGVPRWTGREDVKGKRLLLYAEQGFGDTIQFARYATLAAARGAQVILEVQPALKRLYEGLPGVAQLLARGEKLPAIDFECPLLSAPLAFATDLAAIPRAPAPVRVDAAAEAAFERRLGKRGKTRVGFVASGSTTHKNDKNRSIPMRDFSVFAAPGRQLVCLQKELRASDREALAAITDVPFLGEALADFADTAALVSTLDAIVTVDTSVAHLAASMGKPTFVLLPYNPDWRWLLGRSDSPWYPNMRLFRQPKVDAWGPALAEAAASLDELNAQQQAVAI
jgi:tetratricopeptide (TPR) repeat protein